MSTAQTVYVVSTKDSLGWEPEKTFASLPAARDYCYRKHNIASMKALSRTVWHGKSPGGYDVDIHKMVVFQGAKWA